MTDNEKPAYRSKTCLTAIPERRSAEMQPLRRRIHRSERRDALAGPVDIFPRVVWMRPSAARLLCATVGSLVALVRTFSKTCLTAIPERRSAVRRPFRIMSPPIGAPGCACGASGRVFRVWLSERWSQFCEGASICGLFAACHPLFTTALFVLLAIGAPIKANQSDNDVPLTAEDKAALPEPTTLQTDLWRISCVAFAPDGKTLAVAGLEKSDGLPNPGLVRLLDLTSGREVVTLRFPATLRDPGGNVTHHFINEIKSLAFLPDGRTLVTASHSGAQLWDVGTGKELATLREDNQRQGESLSSAVRSMAVSADGRFLATSHREGVEIWDVQNRKRLLRLPCRGAGAVAFSPDGKVLAAAEGSALLHLWDVATGRKLAEDRAMTGVICSAAFNPDGSILAIAVGGGTKLWRVLRGISLGPATILQDQMVHARHVAFSPDGKLLATGDTAVKLWDVAAVRHLATPDRSARCVTFSPDGKTLAVGGVDGAAGSAVRLWDVATALKPNVIAAQAKNARSDLIRAHEIGNGAQMCNAVTAIGPYSEAAVELLVKALKNPDVTDRGKIAFLLTRTAPRADDLVPALIEATNDESADVRSLVFLALGELGPDAKAATPALIQKLKDPDNYAQINAAYALVKIGPSTVPELLKIIEDDDAHRQMVRWALGAMGEVAVPALTRALTSQKPEIRLIVVEVLGGMGPEAARAVPALKQAVKDPDPAVRKAAVEAIQQIQRAAGQGRHH